jgi:16S rRNA (uracil1498-N3)-methyltransferase
MNRFYHSKPININETIIMDNFAAHHAIKVMRIKKDDKLILFNGDGSDYQGQVININNKNVEVLINSKEIINNESGLKVTLLQALTSSDKMDWIIQKTTELGISCIQPLVCERSTVKIKNDKIEKRLFHWQQVSIAACEQCGRSKIPGINKPENFTKCLDQIKVSDKSLKIILSPSAQKTINDINYNSEQNIKVLIGPEGDFSKQEREFAIKQDFIPIKIGPRILRTETAPITILSILQNLYGDIV